MTVISRTLLLSLALAGGFAGCRSVALDPTGRMVAVHQFGEFKMLLNTQVGPAAQAAEKALQQLDLYQTKRTVNRYHAQFVARARNDQRVTLQLAEVNSQQTLIRIRWGEGGDLVKSRQLYEAVEAHLGGR
jgi:hypothetical protein